MSELDRLGPSWGPLRWLTNTGPGNFALLSSILVILLGAPVAFAMLRGDSWYLGLSSAVPVLMGAIVGMSLKCGHPLNWWTPFFGHTVTANTDRLALREQNGESSAAIQAEIQAWVDNCAKGRSWKVNPYRFKFIRKGDAAFFKLAWG